MISKLLNLTKKIRRGSLGSDFNLLPVNEQPPVVNRQPVNNVTQFTYYNQNGDNIPVKPLLSTVYLLKGTDFTISIVATNPASSGLENLIYRWKFNDSDIINANLQNNNKGTSFIGYTNADTDLNGTYSCVVSNQYGDTQSDEFTLKIVDPIEDPLLYHNILQNGNAFAGLDGWEAAAEVTTTTYDRGLITQRSFSSTPQEITQVVREGSEPINATQLTNLFKFSNSSNWISFYKIIKGYSEGNVSNVIETDRWGWQNVPPCLITNEDGPFSAFGGFFPSPRYIDEYNKNIGNKIDLTAELERSETYFTRKPINYGEPSKVELQQTIDITAADGLIDGYVPGIDSVSAHFFAYTGIGISKYEIKINYVDTNRRDSNYNSLIITAEELAAYVESGYNAANLAKKFNLDEIDRIDITPVTSDVIKYAFECIDVAGRVIGTTVIDGPSNKDIFAIKEKIFLSTRIENLIKSVSTGNSTVPVYFFNKPFFEINGTQNARKNFLQEIGYPLFNEPFLRRKEDLELGAAAMIATDGTFVVPKKTRSIRVRVIMEHTSDGFSNQTATAGIYGWNESEIHSDLLTEGKLWAYGNPRCAATQMKLLLFDTNKPTPSANYTSYFVPPVNIQALEKRLLDTAIHSEFTTQGKVGADARRILGPVIIKDNIYVLTEGSAATIAQEIIRPAELDTAGTLDGYPPKGNQELSQQLATNPLGLSGQ